MSAHMDDAGVQEQGCLFVKTITASDKSRREKVRKAGADTCVRNTLTLHATNGRVVGLAKECLAWIEMDMGPSVAKEDSKWSSTWKGLLGRLLLHLA
jgi:hypothetical protein